jgi:hypothetical protein
MENDKRLNPCAHCGVGIASYIIEMGSGSHYLFTGSVAELVFSMSYACLKLQVSNPDSYTPFKLRGHHCSIFNFSKYFRATSV